MAKRGEVLVAILNNKPDWAHVRDQHWYRIPVANATKWLGTRWPPQWVAFYQTKAFASDMWSVRYYAEVLAIREALSHDLYGWRLTDCTLVVTLEPCTMCAGALVGARIGRIVFGAYEPKTGAVGSVFDVVRDPHVLHRIEVQGGVLEEECQELLRGFFEGLR